MAAYRTGWQRASKRDVDKRRRKHGRYHRGRNRGQRGHRWSTVPGPGRWTVVRTIASYRCATVKSYLPPILRVGCGKRRQLVCFLDLLTNVQGCSMMTPCDDGNCEWALFGKMTTRRWYPTLYALHLSDQSRHMLNFCIAKRLMTDQLSSYVSCEVFLCAINIDTFIIDWRCRVGRFRQRRKPEQPDVGDLPGQGQHRPHQVRHPGQHASCELVPVDMASAFGEAADPVELENLLPRLQEPEGDADQRHDRGRPRVPRQWRHGDVAVDPCERVHGDDSVLRRERPAARQVGSSLCVEKWSC